MLERLNPRTTFRSSVRSCTTWLHVARSTSGLRATRYAPSRQFSSRLSANWPKPATLKLVPCGNTFSVCLATMRTLSSVLSSLCGICLTPRIAKSSKGRESRLTLETQSASGHFYLDFIGGFTVAYRNLTNLVARVRGQRPGCALLISSHFDSAIGSVATSDANAEIAIMTDLLRLFLHDPPDVDVIFNFNGGEDFTILQGPRE